MLSKETIELLEKYQVDYRDMDQEELAEILSGIRELEEKDEILEENH